MEIPVGGFVAFTRLDQRGWRVSLQPPLVCRVGASDHPDPSPGLARAWAAFWGSTLKGPGGPMGPSSRNPTTAFREGKLGCGEKPAHLLPGAAGCLEGTTFLLLSLLGAGGS